MSIETKETLKDFNQNYEKVKDEFADMISFFRQYPDYFLDYIRAENALFELTPFQRVYLRTFFRYKKVGIIASRGVSKCVVGDTLISTDDGLVKIGDLANWEKKESEVVSFNKVMNINGEMEMSDVIVSNGYKDTKKIRTRYGYELEGTKVHPVIAMDKHGNMEFKTLEELEEGDRVAINRKGSFGNNTRLHFDKYDFYEGMTNQRKSRIKESPVPNRLTDDFAYYIGSLVGDGTMTLKDMWIFSSADKESVDFFEKFNREIFGLETKHYIHGNSRYDYKVHSVYVREYLRQIGLGYEKANEKTVPPAIMSAPKSIVASFLSGLLDTDGTVVKNAVQFSTSSEEMSKQVQQLLLQFGIISNRTKHYNKKFKTYSYKLHISSINIDLFKREIGFRLTRKKERLDKLCEKKRNVNCDTIPHQKDRINRIVENNPQFTGKVKGGLGHVRKGDNELTYSRLETLLKQNITYDEDYAMLLGYYEDNFYWDSVEVIEDSKNYVYDFHVPETHTFIGNGFVNHNTYINILAHYIKCVLYPNLHIGVIMPTKIQSAKISEEKIKEIWRDYPLLKNEVKKYKVTRDYVQFEFKGGSTLDTVASGESSRGLRAQGLSFEEIVDERMDRTTINEVLLPLLAQGRRTPHGVDTKNEQQKTQAWVTTAGTKQSFSYEKFQGLYDEMVDGKSTIVLGTSYEMGTKFGTLDINDIVDKLNDPSYSPLSFDREYRSLFTGSSERSLVSMDDINEIRVLENPEYKATAKDKKDQSIKYVLSYDVSRSEGNKNAQSALVVLKLHDRGDGTYRKQLVNIFTGEGTHFREQARFLKKKVNDYGASILIIDHNGIGKGLADELVMEIDENPPYSVVNDDRYDRYRTPESVPLLYLFNSTTKENRNSDVVNHFMTTIANRGVQLLKSEGSARGFIDNIRGSEDEVKKLVPFVQTDRLIDEVMNLEYVQTGVNTTVKAVSRKIEKDRYSAFAYALYYVYIEEQNNKKRKNRVKNNAKSFINIKPPRYRAGV